ncbi:hypothetical protein FQN57_003946 [Myotisia sp. PD_48]|nr:hypothetical protein FQN57_003946 [Myotisia sp. PD_48]
MGDGPKHPVAGEPANNGLNDRDKNGSQEISNRHNIENTPTGGSGASTSIFAKLTLSRMSGKGNGRPGRKDNIWAREEAADDMSHIQQDRQQSHPNAPPERAMASVLQQQRMKTRRRRGSLRKTALLGTGMLRLEGRDKGSSGLKRMNGAAIDQYDGSVLEDNKSDQAQDHHDSSSDQTESRHVSTATSANAMLIGARGNQHSQSSVDGEETLLASRQTFDQVGAISSPTAPALSKPFPPRPWDTKSNTNDAAKPRPRQQLSLSNAFPSQPLTTASIPHESTHTTDDDDYDDDDSISLLDLSTSSLKRQSSATSDTSSISTRHISPHRLSRLSVPAPAPHSSDPYYTHDKAMSSLHERSGSQSLRVRSPLATTNSSEDATGEVWDYSETEWWGWIILIVTWIVFVVGMGSCLGVWSWAWDVGETPYAPPELEDDPTLPIVGYYPALIILTAVMAWVWVVVAWVGMKYFRHANISGEDS